MAAKKKKSGGGSKGKANASESSSASKTAKTHSSSSFAADVGGDGLAAQLPDGFFIKRMPADGNCLFSAVDDQVSCLLESDPGALSTRRWSSFLASCSTLASSPSAQSGPSQTEGGGGGKGIMGAPGRPGGRRRAQAAARPARKPWCGF